jgi:uncharacterized protein (TIGR00661 family)
MKILYAIQGTGNGHISRARAILPELNKFCKTDVLVSGYQSDLTLPFKIDYPLRGLSFIFGKKGGVDLWKTTREANLISLKREINSVPVEKYDLVINDFEPVTAWACLRKKVPSISLSHQSAVIHPSAPRPKIVDLFGKLVLEHYAPSNAQFGFHFESYAENIFTPVIRDEIRSTRTTRRGHYTVYLPSYGVEFLIRYFSQIKDVKWHIFCKHTRASILYKNVSVAPVNNSHFIDSVSSCEGLLCGAGFEAPSEALFLGKKLMCIPMSFQYEQQCNAAALKKMGIPIIKKLSQKNLPAIMNWIDSSGPRRMDYPDLTGEIIKRILESHIQYKIEEELDIKKTA